MKRLIPFLIIPALCVTGCALSGKGTPPTGPTPPNAVAQTQVMLEDTKKLVAEYNADYGHFPKSLRDLSWVNGGIDFQDVWGNDLGYAVNAKEKVVRLWSLGADGEIGGNGDNADMFITFNAFDVTPSTAEKVAQPKRKWF